MSLKLADRLSTIGLRYMAMAGVDLSLIPPTLASFANATPPGNDRSASMLSIDLPDLRDRANDEWLRLSLEGGLFSVLDREFYLAVDRAELGDVRSWWWARVMLMESWDIMGLGAEGPLGNGFCRPGFVMISLDGNVILRGDTWQTEIGCVIVRDPCNAEPFRQHGAWMVERSRSPDWERTAIRRWMERCP